jgi:hypothetical protein
MSLLWTRVAAWQQDYAEDESTHPETMPVEHAGYAGWAGSRYSVEPGDKPHHFNEPLMDHLLDHDGSELRAMSVPQHVSIQEPVYATQSHITRNGLGKYLSGHIPPRPEDKPRFVRHQGNLYVDDGHHRVGAALMLGEKSVDGYYYDADKHGFPGEA